MPVTIWAATLRRSPSLGKAYAPMTVNNAEPMLTSAMVCSPAIRDRHWRSRPIATPIGPAEVTHAIRPPELAARIGYIKGAMGVPVRSPSRDANRPGHRSGRGRSATSSPGR